METYTPIASTTLSASATGVTFSGIPQTYKDLIIKISVRHDSASVANNLWVTFNGSGAANYSYIQLIGNGSTSTSNRGSAIARLVAQSGMVANNATSNTFSNTEIYIPNYALSSHKVASADVGSENNAVEAYRTVNAFLRSVSDPISSVELFPPSGNFLSGSTFDLYGIV